MKELLNPKIYAIVVTYNGQLWVNKCFRSLVNSNIPLNIIAIDNCSTDLTCDIIESNFNDVKLIKSNINHGFGKANNIGLSEAQKNNADFIVLLNQDAWIEPDTIEILIRLSNKNPEYGILSGVHLNADMRELDYNFSMQINPESCPLFISDSILNSRKELYEIKFVNAAFWFITKKCLTAIGGFEPLFFMYGEDDNYINRVHLHKFKVGISPNVKICHDRKGHKGKASINFNQIRTDFLKYVLNPNNNFFLTYINGIIKLNAKLLILLLKHNWLDAQKTFKFFVQAIFSTRRYILARRSY